MTLHNHHSVGVANVSYGGSITSHGQPCWRVTQRRRRGKFLTAVIDVVDDDGVGGVAIAAEEEEEEATDDGGSDGMKTSVSNSREENELKSSIKKYQSGERKIFDRNRIRKG